MKNLFVIILIFAYSSGYAQPKQWTLAECVEYAKENNIDIKSKRLEVETSQINLSEAKWAYAPTISASNSSNLSQGRVLDPTTYQYVEDQTVTGNNTSVSASIAIFDGMINFHNLKRSNLSLSSALLGVQKAENDIMLSITAYYLEVLLAMENIHSCEQIVESLKLQRDNTAKMVEVGKVTSADLLLVESQLSDASGNLLTSKNQLYIAKLNLCQILEIEDFTNFTISPDDIVMTPLQELPQSASEIINCTEWLPELQVAQLNIDIAQRDVKIAKSAYYPTISLSASYGSSYSSAREKALLNEDGTYKYEAYPFNEQYSDNLNGYISLGITIPIFNRMATRKNVERSKVAVMMAELSKHSTIKQVQKEINQAFIDMNIAWDKFNLTTAYQQSAKEALRQIETKYNLGAATIIDYNSAIDTFVDATTKHTSAKYEYIFKTRIIEFYTNQ